MFSRIKNLWRLSGIDFDFNKSVPKPKTHVLDFLEVFKDKRAKIIDITDPLDIDLGDE